MSADVGTYIAVGVDLVAMPPSPALPRVRAYVDGVKVAWRWRDRGNRYWNRTGWFCGACSAPNCWHIEEVEDVLSSAVIQRLREIDSGRSDKR